MIIFQNPHFCNKNREISKFFSFEIPLTAYAFGGFYFLVEKFFQKRQYKIPKRGLQVKGQDRKKNKNFLKMVVKIEFSCSTH